MFGRRADGTLVRDLSTMRRFMPFISPRRNESLVYYAQEIEADAALRFLEEINRGRPEDGKVTLFHLVLRSLARTFHSRPHVNRFVAGGRLWQRNGVWFSFAAKQEFLPGSPLLTIKREFPEHEGIEEMVDAILDGIRSRRRGKKTRSDKEMSFANLMPPFLIRIGVRLLHAVNMLGLLPKSMIDDDPLFVSLFAANLGSVGLEAGYHHLWEYGTCSAFAVMGQIKERPDGSHYFVNKYSYDERMEDGLYGGLAMEEVRLGVENPEKLR